MGSKRRKFIRVDPVEAYAIVGRLGIGDPVVLVCGDIEVTVTVNKLERSRRLPDEAPAYILRKPGDPEIFVVPRESKS